MIEGGGQDRFLPPQGRLHLVGKDDRDVVGQVVEPIKPLIEGIPENLRLKDSRPNLRIARYVIDSADIPT